MTQKETSFEGLTRKKSSLKEKVIFLAALIVICWAGYHGVRYALNEWKDQKKDFIERSYREMEGRPKNNNSPF